MNVTLFSYSEVVSDQGSLAIGDCYKTVYDFIRYGKQFYAEFSQPANIATAFMQNLVGNAILFSNLGKQITAA